MGKRINHKILEQVPTFKKKVAKFLASVDIANGVERSIEDILVLGHRGYVQFNEKDLCKLFDKAYKKLAEDIQEIEKDIAEGTPSWRFKSKLEALREQILVADSIITDIVEREVLT